MPIYTYRCSNCGVQFEKQQSFYDQSLIRCPECGKRALKKVYLPVGIVFKGSGFYATDHHSPSGQTNLTSEKESTPTKETSHKDGLPAEKSEKSENKPEKTKGNEKTPPKE